MNIDEVKKSVPHCQHIREFVTNPLFLEIKDAFVSHTPEALREGEDGDSKMFGKLIGTRYVLNTFENIARVTPPPKQSVRSQSGRRDPDLDVT